jgi:glycolate oxidase FAD binding subunit
MKTTLTPANCAELVEAVRSTPRLLAVGAGTKPRLSDVDCVKVSTAKLSGIIEYEPSEFTFTALAGTPLREIAVALAERGQYLPFDPMLLKSGATLGGTVAAGLSGPGRFRFGGLRDFILGVRFVDGAGRLMRLGGKVVKNAAGFDVPKFFVGSLGRFGVLAEITFKVFPLPAAQLTLKLEAKSSDVATKILTGAASARWELQAIDWLAESSAIAVRLAGPEAALEPLAQEILSRWPGERLKTDAATELWTSLSEFGWAKPDGLLLKVPLRPEIAAPCRQMCESLGGRIHISAGGNVGYAAFAPDAEIPVFSKNLEGLGLSALTLRGNAPLWLGRAHDSSQISTAVKTAFDAENRFPSLND